MNATVAAGGDFIFWIIIGIFWIIQFAVESAKKKKRFSPPADSGEQAKPAVDPLTELLRKLSEGQPFEIPKPEFQELPEEPNIAQHDSWVPEKVPVPTDYFCQTEPPPVPVAKPVETAKPVEVPEIDIRPTMKAFRSASAAMKQPSMSLRFQGLEMRSGAVSGLVNLINPADKRTLRRAMLSHVIFSPPKAFEEVK